MISPSRFRSAITKLQNLHISDFDPLRLRIEDLADLESSKLVQLFTNSDYLRISADTGSAATARARSVALANITDVIKVLAEQEVIDLVTVNDSPVLHELRQQFGWNGYVRIPPDADMTAQQKSATVQMLLARDFSVDIETIALLSEPTQVLLHVGDECRKILKDTTDALNEIALTVSVEAETGEVGADVGEADAELGEVGVVANDVAEEVVDDEAEEVLDDDEAEEVVDGAENASVDDDDEDLYVDDADDVDGSDRD